MFNGIKGFLYSSTRDYCFPELLKSNPDNFLSSLSCVEYVFSNQPKKIKKKREKRGKERPSKSLPILLFIRDGIYAYLYLKHYSKTLKKDGNAMNKEK